MGGLKYNNKLPEWAVFGCKILKFSPFNLLWLGGRKAERVWGNQLLQIDVPGKSLSAVTMTQDLLWRARRGLVGL